MPTPFPFVSGAVLTASNLNSISELPTRTLTGSGAAVAADSYSRVILNGTSITYTVNTSTFAAGQVVELYNANSTAATIAAGAGVTLNGAAGLTLAQYQTAELYAVSATSFVLWKSDVTVTTPGLVRISGETAISGASSVTLDNVFTSTYTNYRINLVYNTSTTNDVSLRLRTGGSSASTSYNRQTFQSTSTTNTGANATGQSSYLVGPNSNGARRCYATIDVSGPQVADQTAFQVNVTLFQGDNSGRVYFIYGMHDVATSYDGFELLVATGTFSGSYTVYGYAKS